jgi:hypothetical protein
MQRRLHPITVVMALAVVFFAIFIVYSRKMDTTGPRRTITDWEARGGVPPPHHNTELGIMESPVPGRHAMKIMGFRGPPGPSPLMIAGCRPRDIVIECNGKQFDYTELDNAVEELREKGTPFTLTVERGGQTVTVNVSHWPKRAPGPPGVQPGSARSGPQRSRRAP